jgi:hypothetical protein
MRGGEGGKRSEKNMISGLPNPLSALWVGKRGVGIVPKAKVYLREFKFSREGKNFL